MKFRFHIWTDLIIVLLILQLSPLYETLKEKGAVYEDVYGWERPYWYALGDTPQKHIESFKRSELHTIIGNEVKGLRAHAGIADLTAFAKLEVFGDDAEPYLSRISSNKIPQKIGSISLTYLMLENGRIEGEATFVKLGENHFYVVYAAVREAALKNWMEEQINQGESVDIVNVSEDYGVIMLAGPASRKILAECTDVSLDNADFRWLSTQHITVAGVENVRAMRVSYTGELGWELHVSMAGMLDVYTALVSTSHSENLVHVGSASLNAMRMEKAYRSGSEITNEVTLTEADVMRFSRTEGFQGAIPGTKAASRYVLTYLQIDEPTDLDDNADPLGSESVWYQGKPVGQISSGGYGYAVNHHLAYAFVPPDLNVVSNEFEILILGKPRRAVVVEQCVYDNENKLPRSND